VNENKMSSTEIEETNALFSWKTAAPGRLSSSGSPTLHIVPTAAVCLLISQKEKRETCSKMFWCEN